MVEELKLAIKIDDASIEQSLLKQFANAQKMADKVVLDFKNVNFDDKQIETKFKEMQKKAGQNPINLTISNNALDMLGQIDKRLTEIFSIGKGKSFIDSSSITADIDKIENKINELNKKYEEAQKKSSSIGSGNVFGKDVNLIDNVDFQKLIQEVSELKNQFDDLKTHMQLLDDYTVPTDRFFELQSQVEGTTARVSDLVKEISRLSSEVGATDGFAWELEDLKKKVNEVFEEINKSKKNLNDKNDVVDKNSLETIINLFSKMESSLSSIKGVLVDVGDGEELSPLLSEINNIQTAIGGLSSSLNNLHFNMNIDMGTDNQMDTKIQEKAAKALNAYEKLFNGLKMSGYGGEVVNNKFFDFDINKFDTTIGKVKAYKDIIERLRKEAKEYYSGADLLRTQTDDKLWRSASSAGGQLTQAINETAKIKADNPLENLFGKTDLSGVIEQLNTIVSKLDEISVSAKGFTETFKNGLNVNTSVEEIEKLTNRVKELESELAKIKTPTAVTSEPTKDAFPKTSENLEQVAQSEQKVQQEAVATDKALDNISFTPNTEGFDDIIVKFGILREQAEQITKIVKTTKQTADGAPDTSYKATLRNGNSYYLGENSTPQVLNANETVYDSKAIEKAYQEATKVNNALNETNSLLNSLKVPNGFEGSFSTLESEIKRLNSEFGSGKISATEYANSIKKAFSDYQTPIDNHSKNIWNELTTSLERYATIQKRIASNNALSTDNEEATKLLEHIHELQRNDILPTEKLTASNEKLQQISQTVTDLKAKLKESTLDSLQGSIDKYQKIYNQRSTYSSDFTPSEQYTKNLTELNTAIKNLVEYRNALKKVGEVTVEQEAHLKGLVAVCEKASDSFKSLSSSEKGASQIAVDKLVQRINKDLDECTNYSKEAKLGLRALRDELESANPRNLKEITSEIINIENAEIKAGRAGRSFFDTLKNSGFHQIAAQMAGMFGFYDVINLGKEGLSVVRELNTALTEMRKVSDESLQSLKNYQNTTFDTADAVGTTAKQIQTSTADYMRLGESLDKAAESAKTANVLLNVSEFDNIEDATKSLVAMGQAYKDLDKMTIVDKLNEVGNNYAISTDELATALQKSAATLSLMGNTIDESSSLVTTANATIQDADSVSAGLRTISLRLVGTEEAEEELSAMNEEVDAFVKATNSKKQQIIKDYTAVASNNYQGFDILDNNGNYKNTYEILLGIAKVYKEIQEQDKKLGTNHATALIEELAGKNRSNIASAILQDPTQLEAVKKSSEEAMGSAEKELNSYLDSIDGKMAQLENRAQEFWFKVVDSEAIKNGIDLLSTLLKGATDFVDTVGLLPTILTGIGAGLSFKNIGKCYVSA